MRAILKVGMREGGQIAFHFSKLLTFRYCKGQFPSTHLLIDKLVCKGTQSTTLLYALHVYMILGPCRLTYIQPIIYNCIIQCIIIQIHKMPVCGHSSHTHTSSVEIKHWYHYFIVCMHWMDDDICTHSSSLIHVTDSADLFLLFSRNKTIGLTSLANAWAALHNMYIHSTVTFYSSTLLLASQFPSFRHGSCNAPINGMPYLQYLGWWGVGGELTCPSRKSPHTWGTNLCTMPLHTL